MITLQQYFGKKVHPHDHEVNADILLSQVNRMLYEAKDLGWYDDAVDPDTGTQISGSANGAGDGGYRLPSSTTGVAGSKHRTGQAVDVFDVERKLVMYIKNNLFVLKKYNLYCESFEYTPTWVHFQTVPPKSKRRIFIP